MQPTLRILTVLLLASLSLPACSFSRQARNERMQNKYARRMIRERDKSMAAAAKEANLPLRHVPGPSAPVQTISLEPAYGSESMTPPPAVAEGSSGQPTP